MTMKLKTYLDEHVALEEPFAYVLRIIGISGIVVTTPKYGREVVRFHRYLATFKQLAGPGTRP